MVEFVVEEQLVELIPVVEFVPVVVPLVPVGVVELPPTVPLVGGVCEQLVVPAAPVVVVPVVMPVVPVVLVPVVPVELTGLPDPTPAVPALPVVLGKVAETPVVALGLVEVAVVPPLPVVF